MRFQQESEGRTLTPSLVGSNPAIPTKIKAVREDSFYFGCKSSARIALMAIRFCFAKKTAHSQVAARI